MPRSGCSINQSAPELPAQTPFSDIEIRVLKDFARENGQPLPENQGWVAVTRGYLKHGRKHLALPGVAILWKG